MNRESQMLRRINGHRAAKELSKLARLSRLSRLDSQMAEILTSEGVLCPIEGVVVLSDDMGVARWEIAIWHGKAVYVGFLAFPRDAAMPPLISYRERPGGRDLVGTIIRVFRALADATIDSMREKEDYEQEEQEEQAEEVLLGVEDDDQLEVDLIMESWYPGSSAAEIMEAIRATLLKCLGDASLVLDEASGTRPRQGKEMAKGYENAPSREEQPALDTGGGAESLLSLPDEVLEDDDFAAWHEAACDQTSAAPSHVSFEEQCFSQTLDQPAVQMVLLPHTPACTAAADVLMSLLENRHITSHIYPASSPGNIWPPFAWVVVCLVDSAKIGPDEWEAFKVGVARGNAVVVPVLVAEEVSGDDQLGRAPGWTRELSWVSWRGEGRDGDAACGRVVDYCTDVAHIQDMTREDEEDKARGSHFVSYCWSNSSMAARAGCIPTSITVGDDWSDPRQIAAAIGGITIIDCDNGGACSQHGVLHWAHRCLSICECAVLFASDEYAASPRCVLEGWHVLSCNPGGFRSAGMAVIVAVVGQANEGMQNDVADSKDWEKTWLGKAASGCARVDFRGIKDRASFNVATSETFKNCLLPVCRKW